MSYVSRLSLFVLVALGFVGPLGGPITCHAQLTLLEDMVLDNDALLMPASATYGRAINGVAFQTEALLSHGGYQYAAWYHNGSDEDVYLARRNLGGHGWEVMDTGVNMTNGDGPSWDAHNVIAMGVGGHGSMHLAWDHHGHTLRYLTSEPGAATGAAWNNSLLSSERNSLNPGGAAISAVTYPRFVTDPATGDMYMTYRTGGSGAGNLNIATYDSQTGLWNAPQQFINGTAGLFYDDAYGASSTDRNAYLNGVDVDSTGRIHTTWTWRESAGGTNHDIMYAYSDDGGQTWRNNASGVVGAPGSPIDLNSPDIIVVPMDRGNTLMNQQTQAVDGDGRAHMVMWHKTDEAAPVANFTTGPAAYFHYYRDPSTGAWDRTELPRTRAVGSRPDMAYDEHGNLYVTYLSPGLGDNGGYYTSGDLIVAAASKATGYEDWEIVYTDTRDFAGEPRVDGRRLLNDGVLSVFVQENDANQPGATGTPLRVLEWEKLANLVVWAGDDQGTWSNGGGTDWDNDNNNAGEATFAPGYRVSFDDGAATYSVNVASPVAPSAVAFRNTAGREYALTGSPIIGNGGLTLSGGGTVTLANGANAYTGKTSIDAGTLKLAGSGAVTGSSEINVAAGAVLDAMLATSGGVTLQNQTLHVAGRIIGNVSGFNGSTIQIASSDAVSGNVAIDGGSMLQGAGRVKGSVSAQGGALLRVGGAGLPTVLEPSVTLVDDFDDGNLSEYIKTVVNDGNGTPANITFSAGGGQLQANYSGSAAYEQALLLRDDVSLQVGDTLIVDVAMGFTFQQMDFGLAVSATAMPAGVSGGDSDTRDTFDWTSVSIRPNGNNIRVNRSAGGAVDTTSGALSGVSEGALTALFINRLSSTQLAVGYLDDELVAHFASAVNFGSAGVGTAIGFYADLRSDGSLGAFDNLRIIDGDSQVAVGETLYVDGDVSLAFDARLQLDVFSPAIGDRLEVGGAFMAGGVLDVALAADAPAPGLGDQFQLVQCDAITGDFDAYVLPPLAAGLAWNVSEFTSSGAIVVAPDVDLNDDGWVDGADFLAIQRASPALLSTWADAFGNRLVTPGAASALTVPEPSGALAMSLALALPVLRAWSASTSR